MTLEERLAKFATQGSDNFLKMIREEVKNQYWLEKSSLFADAVRQHLIDHNLTQKELAVLLNTSPQHISKILSGRENLSLSTIADVEQALGSRFTAFGLQYSDPEWYHKYIELDDDDLGSPEDFIDPSSIAAEASQSYGGIPQIEGDGEFAKAA